MEKAECKLDCSIITVSGLGTKTDSLTKETKVTHDAFGIIAYNKKTDKFNMRAYKKDDVIEAEIEFVGKKLSGGICQLQMEAPYVLPLISVNRINGKKLANLVETE
ncbi:MAG: hypothetical protein SH818_05365 [Saprospiraceae bacterium]|nr:hypothetical protein [Saprospiraceae bacterium]